MKSAQSLDRMSTALRTFYNFCPLFEFYFISLINDSINSEILAAWLIPAF